MKGPPRDLAFIDACEKRARAKTLEQISKPRDKRRRRSHVTSARSRGKLARALVWRKLRKLVRAHRRNRGVEAARREILANGAQEQLTSLELQARTETKAERYRRDCAVRFLTAECLRRLEDAKCHAKAEALENAGRSGWWGVRENPRSGAQELVVRLRDRSGLIMLDPAEARERARDLIERLVPLLLACKENGLEIYKAVFSEPNVAGGSLEWGKRHIFQRFVRSILERDEKGEPRADRELPEILGAFAVQEDPLGAGSRSWNCHLNVLLVVDPKQCTPLAPELCDTPDPAGPGMLSYKKLRHVWGTADQLEIRWINKTRDALIDELKECIKYPVKTVCEKSLEELQDPGARADELRTLGELPEEWVWTELPGSPGELQLEGQRAPAMNEWPVERLREWLDANKGFRRVRAWGVLYRLGKLPKPDDLDEGIRWLGRIYLSPWRVTVQLDWVTHVDSIRENKSRRGISTPYAQGPPPDTPGGAFAA